MEIEILGSAIKGALGAISNQAVILKDFPRMKELENMEDSKFYPLSLYTDLTDYVEKKMNKSYMINVGREVGKAVIQYSLEAMKIKTVPEAIYAINEAHKQFCKPVKGEFKIISEEGKKIRILYTAPYNKSVQEGLIYEIAMKYGTSLATVKQLTEKINGAESTIFEVGYI